MPNMPKSDIPPGALLLGYTKCVINERPTAADIALPETKGRYKWYSGQWWMKEKPSLDLYETVNGVLSIKLGGEIVSAPHDFSEGLLPYLPGSDGFYVEFDVWLSDNDPDHWPALWLMPKEHNWKREDNYPELGDPPGFQRWMELDVDEGGFGPGLTGTVHHWFGIWEEGFKNIQNPNNVSPLPLDRTQKHTFGASFDPKHLIVTWWVDGVPMMSAGGKFCPYQPSCVPVVARKQNFYIIISAQSHGKQKPYRIFVSAVRAYVPPYSKLKAVKN